MEEKLSLVITLPESLAGLPIRFEVNSGCRNIALNLESSFSHIEDTNCVPLPCTRLSLAQTTMDTPLPCRIFRAVAHSRVTAFRFRQSPFSTHDNYWRNRLSDATFILISAYCGYAMTSSCHAHTKNWAWCHGMA